MLPNLHTKRLVLRRPHLGDEESIYRLGSNPRVMQYITPGKTQTREQAKQDLTKRIAISANQPYGYWLVETKETTEFVGWVALKPLDQTTEMEVGYRFMEEMWGKGYATEAAMSVLQYGFLELGLDRIVGITLPENKRSARVLQKLGLSYEKTAVFYQTTCVYYALNRADWQDGQ